MDSKDTAPVEKPAIEKSGDESPRATQVEEDYEFLQECQPREKELMRKVDWRLLPILGALYAIALVDRVNVRWPDIPTYTCSLSASPLCSRATRSNVLISCIDIQCSNCWDG